MIGEYFVILLIIIIIAAIVHTLFMHQHSQKRTVEPVMDKHEFVAETKARLTYWGQHNKADLDSELRAIEQQLRELDMPKAEQHLQPYIKHTHKIVKNYLANYDTTAASFTKTEQTHDQLVDIHNKLSEVGVTHHVQRQIVQPLSINDQNVTKDMLEKIVRKLENNMIPRSEVEKIDEMLSMLTQR